MPVMIGSGSDAAVRRRSRKLLVALGTAKLGAAIGQHARQPDGVLVIERHHPIIEDLGRGDRGLAVIELGKGDFGIGVDKGLLTDPADTLQGADIEGVLGTAITGTFALKLAVRFLVGLGLLEGGDLGLVNRMPSPAFAGAGSVPPWLRAP